MTLYVHSRYYYALLKANDVRIILGARMSEAQAYGEDGALHPLVVDDALPPAEDKIWTEDSPEAQAAILRRRRIHRIADDGVRYTLSQ